MSVPADRSDPRAFAGSFFRRLPDGSFVSMGREQQLARQLLAALDREAELLAWQDNVCAESVRAANAAEAAEARADALEAALREIDSACTDAFGEPERHDSFDDAHRRAREALARRQD